MEELLSLDCETVYGTIIGSNANLLFTCKTIYNNRLFQKYKELGKILKSNMMQFDIVFNNNTNITNYNILCFDQVGEYMLVPANMIHLVNNLCIPDDPREPSRLGSCITIHKYILGNTIPMHLESYNLIIIDELLPFIDSLDSITKSNIGIKKSITQ